LFAKSEDDLLPAAVALFRTLRQLEDRPDSDLTSAYSSFGLDLGANVLKTVTSATGSSELTPENQAMIGNLIADMPDGDLLFVVGYASRTGNPESNETLSSDRATAVAEYYSGMKRPGQMVQGTPSSNILEIRQHERAELFDGQPVAGWARKSYPSPADEWQTCFSRTVKGLIEFYG
jgi:hypothetical protein